MKYCSSVSYYDADILIVWHCGYTATGGFRLARMIQHGRTSGHFASHAVRLEAKHVFFLFTGGRRLDTL
jgi:hypothetical protein